MSTRIIQSERSSRTVLHESVLQGNYAQFEELLRNGADTNIYEGELNNLLFIAVQNRRHSFVLRLIHYGADIEAINSRGQTALDLFNSRNGFGSMGLWLPTRASVQAYDALRPGALEPVLEPALLPLLPGVIDVEYTDLSIVSPNGEVHLARVSNDL